MAWREKRLDGGADEVMAHFMALAKNAALAFRGMPNAKWPLRSSIDRLLDVAVPPEAPYEECLAFERRAIQLFQAEGPAHLPLYELNLLQNPVTTLTVMQHYGAPTRLLDWTHSPWVALFFAVRDVVTREAKGTPPDGAVYHFDVRNFDVSVSQDWPEPIERFKRGEHEELFGADPTSPAWLSKVHNLFGLDPRMSAQRGFFTICSRLRVDQGQLFETIAGRHGFECVRLVIPGSVKLGVLAQLEAMSISARTLFPGLPGLGEAIAIELAAHGSERLLD